MFANFFESCGNSCIFGPRPCWPRGCRPADLQPLKTHSQSMLLDLDLRASIREKPRFLCIEIREKLFFSFFVSTGYLAKLRKFSESACVWFLSSHDFNICFELPRTAFRSFSTSGCGLRCFFGTVVVGVNFIFATSSPAVQSSRNFDKTCHCCVKPSSAVTVNRNFRLSKKDWL